MSHFLEVVLFIVLFCFIFYLFFTIIGLYHEVEKMISNSELKMNDKLQELRNEFNQSIKGK